ncbi:hypothetical protein [Devosia faecipullorum]|uniref:hypothetical protein n=1 Tax=Devosia faecipullorum TaxID=2755039 RepID=UPI00187BABCE|nr:hypothetical protein [Devosia faecipullorum]MBE7733643.1 hypothetical protein [Devosia faecipullorum]
MSGTVVDFAVFGSTPLARLLAGLLADMHGRQVVHIGDSPSIYRLTRSIDLSVAPITRPESWALLGRSVDETLKLIARLAGRNAWGHADPVFFADDPRAEEALSHMRHMAQGFGIATEPTPPSLLGGNRSGICLRDAVRLNRAVLEPGIETWLKRAGVLHLKPQTVTTEPGGSAELVAGGSVFHARQAILADDDAIIAHLPRRQWPALLRQQQAASILAFSAPKLVAPIMLNIQSGLTLIQQENGLAAIGLGEMAQVSSQTRALLDQNRPVEQTGQTNFAVLTTSDGAPAMGRVAGTGVDIVAAMGMIGAFLAPALARWLCGESDGPDEAAWFGARLVSREAKPALVGDFVPIAAGVSA